MTPDMNLLRRPRRRRRALLSDEGGASAIEFALVLPILVLACLATVDVGLAINERMEIDHSLRAGSEGAMRDLGEEEVHDLIDAVASEVFTVRSEDEDEGEIDVSSNGLDVTVERFCTCPESVGAAVSCTAGNCADEAKPYLYYRLSAEKDFATILLPTIPLESSLLVQVE
jgi:pilus assembly protein CpaE